MIAEETRGPCEPPRPEALITNSIHVNKPPLLDFRDARFRVLKVRPHSKQPLENGWTTSKNYEFSSKEIDDWIWNGGNYGLTCPSGDCCFVDADTREIQALLDEKLPTFWYSSGKEGHRQYVYGILDPPIGNIPLKDGAYIKGKGGFAVGPGSIHPNGNIYGLKRSGRPILEVSKKELLEVLGPFIIRKTEPIRNTPIIERKAILWISLGDIIDLSKFRKSGNQYQGSHPIHGSETGVNLSVDLSKNVWHCFRHNSGGSVLEWIAVSERIIDCSQAVPGTLRGEKFWEVVEVANRKYGLTPGKVAAMLRKEDAKV